ncbi:PfkB family carbohydrate kinase [Nitratireductor kimnyeongensis]|uniref:PfkB family carbohydrate kinase n=1 Tax=Nitratireductor kimnyeongensis TaxID=430679 RepID=A0ABW0T489_9HYPH|nr:PfkB family carbohydrate kinase [Nitratireductor kimnyeongensis]QZZ34821.1 bifunctional hydroxymethylpyrimidine kinase/phosphomethylpyrimidine kinase [Nitratireductor kimnyeongensis]
MTRLIHAGSAVVDYVYRIDALPKPGGEMTASSYNRIAGGGFNVMVAARRTGLPVAFAGRHGTGPEGDFLRAAFAAEGVETLTPPASDLDSGNCVVLVTADAERTFVSWPGAEAALTIADLAPITLQEADWVFISGYTLTYPDSRQALADWVESLPASTPVVFDPTPVVAEIPSSIRTRVLARTTWLSCNSVEARTLAGAADPATNAVLLMAEHCPRANGVVIRSGAFGAHLLLRDGSIGVVDGFSVPAVDTNGAGDTHIGAFVAALARGEQPFAAVRYANAAAAISVGRHGGCAAPGDTEIRAFLTERKCSGPAEEMRREQKK